MLSDRHIFAFANVFFSLTNTGLLRRFRKNNGHLPNIANPHTYAERMLWRKIVDHNPQFVIFCDKLAAKEFVQRLCPELPIPKTLWIGQNVDAIPGELLRGDVYVKASHGCDFNFRIRGGKWDRTLLRQKAAWWMRKVYGKRGGEWSYSRVKPQLFVEEAIGDTEAGLLDLNVRASNGKAILGSLIINCKTPRQRTLYFDPAGNRIQGAHDADDAPIEPLPDGLDVTEPYLHAVRLAKRMSLGVDYARFDFMWNGKTLYGGEITVYPAGGWKEFDNSKARNATLDGWDMLQSHFLKSEHTGWKKIYADALRRRFTRNGHSASL
jgi:hypothetical protein